MKKLLEISFALLVIVIIIEAGYYMYLTKFSKVVEMTNNQPKAREEVNPTLIVSPQKIDKWDIIRKNRMTTNVYEGIIEKVDLGAEEVNPLTLVFDSKNSLIFFVEPSDLPNTRVYELNNQSLYTFDYKLLKAGDTVVLRVSTKDGKTEEIEIIKK